MNKKKIAATNNDDEKIFFLFDIKKVCLFACFFPPLVRLKTAVKIFD